MIRTGMNFLKRFRRDTSGAVTVDWVLLTAAIVGLGVAVLTSVGGGTTQAADSTGGCIQNMGSSYETDGGDYLTQLEQMQSNCESGA